VSISDLLKFGGRRESAASTSVRDAPAPKGPEPVVPSKALPKFISALSHQNAEAPLVLVDFGPVVGPNVAFFGERLGCKLFIEDLAEELDRHTRTEARAELAGALTKRLPHAEGSVDGVLCWDFFDFLERPAATALAHDVVRMLRPGGAVLAFFCTSAVERAPYTKFEIVEEPIALRHRHRGGIGGPKYVLQNRDIIRMFEGLLVSESFLLKSNTREILLRRRS
jgi:Methyltransferase domain